MADVVEDEKILENEKGKPVGKEAFYAKIRESYPDEEFDDEGTYDKAIELLDGLSKYKGDRSAIDEKLKQEFEADPKLGAVFSEIVEGKAPFRAILAKHYAPEDLTPQEGDEDFEAYQKGKADRMKGIEDEKAYQAKFQENLANAETVMQKFAEEKGMDEKGVLEFSQKIEKVLGDLGDGVLEPDTLSLFYKGLNYEKDTANAAEVAELKGKNAAIKDKMQQEPKGDGLPDTSKSSTAMKEPKVSRQKELADKVFGNERKVF